MQKNVASQKLIVYAFDSTTNLPKTGDAANLTAYVSKDYGAVTVLGDTSATEMESSNAKGFYLFDLTQAETNADTLLFSGKSSTANVVVIAMPATVFATPANFSLESIDGSGKITVGTNSDKTGYVLTQAFPANFSSLGITAGGHISDVDTLTTYTGNTLQTGDSFARIGLAGAGLTSLGDTRLAHLDEDVSTRLASVDYTAPPSASTIATAVRDVSNGAPATGSLGEACRNADAKAASLIITIGSPSLATVSDDIAGITAKTVNLPASPAAVGSAMTLANASITDSTFSVPAEAGGRPTGMLSMMRRVFEWIANKRTRNRSSGVVALRNASDTGDLEVQTQSTTGSTDTQTQGS